MQTTSELDVSSTTSPYHLAYSPIVGMVPFQVMAAHHHAPIFSVFRPQTGPYIGNPMTIPSVPLVPHLGIGAIFATAPGRHMHHAANPHNICTPRGSHRQQRFRQGRNNNAHYMQTPGYNFSNTGGTLQPYSSRRLNVIPAVNQDETINLPPNTPTQNVDVVLDEGKKR